jgi:hypothetical protein
MLSAGLPTLKAQEFRPHVGLIVSAFGESAAPTALDLVGATSRFVWGEQLTDKLKMPTSTRLLADAILLDATAPSRFSNELFRCLSLGKAIRRLSDATMPTGVRWSALPIILLVENEAVLSTLLSYGLSDRVTAFPKSRGWSMLYDFIVKTALEFSLALVSQMQSLGWELHYHRGRWLRVKAKLPGLKGGYRRAFESDFYDGASDRWLRAKPGAVKRQLSMAGFDETMTLQDVLYLQSLIIDPHVTETALQRLLEEAPYLLRAARLELVAKPRFVRESTGDVKYPDVIIHPALQNDIGITELKLPRAQLVARRGKLIYQSAGITAGIAQLQDYAEIAVNPSHASQMQAIFEQPIEVSSRSLIIGMSAGVDPDALEKVRSKLDGVELKTWDSVLDDAVERYAGRRGNRPEVPDDSDEWLFLSASIDTANPRARIADRG